MTVHDACPASREVDTRHIGACHAAVEDPPIQQAEGAAAAITKHIGGKKVGDVS